MSAYCFPIFLIVKQVSMCFIQFSVWFCLFLSVTLKVHCICLLNEQIMCLSDHCVHDVFVWSLCPWCVCLIIVSMICLSDHCVIDVFNDFLSAHCTNDVFVCSLCQLCVCPIMMPMTCEMLVVPIICLSDYGQWCMCLIIVPMICLFA